MDTERGTGGSAISPADLDDWIAACEQLRSAAEDAGMRDFHSGRLAVGLTQRAGPVTGPSPDRDRAVELLDELARTPVADEEYRLEVRRLLAQQLLLRALPAGLDPLADPARVARAMAASSGADLRPDVELAVEQLTLALDSPAGSDPATRGALAGMLSQAMLLRSVTHPVAGDLDRVIRSLDQARATLPGHAPGRAELVHQLGRLRAERAARSGWPVAEIAAAVEELSEAERLLPAGHPLRAQALCDLGQCLLQRAVLTGSGDDEQAAARALESALRLLPGADPRRPDVLHRLGSVLLKSATASPDRIVDLAREAVALGSGARRQAQLRIHLANALAARFARTAREADSAQAVVEYEQALALVPEPGDDLRLLALTSLGSMLADRFDARHDVQDIDRAIACLAEVDATLTRHPEAFTVAPMPARGYARSLLAGARFQKAQRDELAGRPQSGLVEAVRGLEAVLSELAPEDPMRPRIRSELDAARMLLALRDPDARGPDLAVARRSALSLVAQADAVPDGHPDRAVLLGRAGTALALTGAAARRVGVIDEGVALLERALTAAGAGPGGPAGHTPALRLRLPAGEALLERHHLDGRPATLDAAVDQLARAWQEAQAHPGHPLTPLIARTLARAYRRRSDPGRPDRADAARVALVGLQAHARNVLLQNGSERGLTAARAAADDVLLATLRDLDDGRTAEAVAALETGRALVLHATTAAGGVAAALETAGRGDLAARWRSAPAGDPDDPGGPGGPEGLADESLEMLDLRHRTLTALTGTPAYERLTAPVPLAELGPALADAGRDALVYLIPAVGDQAIGADPGERHPGRALVVWFDGVVVELELPGLEHAADGPIVRYDEARVAAQAGGPAADGLARLWQRLSELVDWAGAVAIAPVRQHLRERVAGRDPRLVVVPVGTLGVVPWHVARLGTGAGSRYALQDIAISYASSARQLIEATRRPRLHPDSGVSLVADPDGSLPYAAAGAEAVRDAFYPDAVYLGRPRRIANGRGVAAEILAQLPGAGSSGAAILEFDCHATTGDSPGRSRLLLADGELPVERLLRHAAGHPIDRPGGLVLLSACVSDLAAQDHDEALTLATAFLATGAVSVIGSRWAIDDEGTAVFMFMFHHFFDHGRRSPGAALRATQCWMIDPGRAVPDEMPGWLAESARVLDLTAIRLWGAFSHHGW